ncbi:MAG: cell division protein FtsL [Proteobacteria bacterium]|nr:cell division protein FtsL [Pseudomonadota bacterium]
MSKGNRKRASDSNTNLKPKIRFEIRRSPARPHKLSHRARVSSRVYEKAPASYLVVICMVVVIVAGAFIFHLHVRFEGVKLGYEMSQSRAERARLLVERRELRLELASLKAPQRVESEAREKLGMEMPDHNRIIPVGKKRQSVLASGGAR